MAEHQPDRKSELSDMASTSEEKTKPGNGAETAGGSEGLLTSPKSNERSASTPAKVLSNKGQRELLLVDKISKNRNKTNPFPPCEPLSIPRRRPLVAGSPFQLTREDWPPETDNTASHGVPIIRVKNTDTGSIQEGAGGSVLPANHIQSPHFLRVNDSARDRNAERRHITLQRERRNFWDIVDRALGLHRVRTFGENGGDKRLAAKRAIYRGILIFGILMMVSLITSAVLFVVQGSKGNSMGPEWFVWMGVSGAGLIWSVLAFIMANRQKNQAQFDEEIARQRIVLRRRLQSGIGVELDVVSSPNNNEQQIQRAAAAGGATATSVAAAAVAPLDDAPTEVSQGEESKEADKKDAASVKV
ncbi:uncharacterized protein CTRU02_210781 [Colletotrichum truncatum]|uniref:Uncharacterized protein n=1 Tax=Colletotrichum truncatum TaxID=5467 RepID=A0ACC3YQ54_COLTU|nr:uncharacterized protein CTRU02_03732 [Colletotrichum truncatum]KAF6796754.1 hypothetical protein CTRU02_03732 [Colletotrichum truncatum]